MNAAASRAQGLSSGLALGLAGLLPCVLAGQQPAADSYTAGAAAAMAAAGVVAYAPFPWADFKTTADIDRALGENRVLWLETAHLRIGTTLAPIGLPLGKDERRAVLDELSQLHDKLPAVPTRPKKLDPWLRLHLFAQRAEQCYARFQQLIGLTDADFPVTGDAPGQGAYLGQQGKFLLLLLQKKSDLARYLERFCNMHQDQPARYYHQQTGQLVAVICCEGFEQFDDAALHRYAIYSLIHNFVNGYRGFYYEVPMWLDEGLAHWFSRQVESDFVTFRKDPDEAVNKDRQHLWPQKVRQRLEHPEFVIPFAEMAKWARWEDMGYHDHLQAWSRVDYLMRLDPQLLGMFLTELKKLPPLENDKPIARETIDQAQRRLMQQLWQMDGEIFDQEWRQWVLKTYSHK